MPYTPFPVEQHGGLNLISDPDELGPQRAIDLLNVDLDKRGRVRSRDGYDNLTASAAASRLDSIQAFYKIGGSTKQVLVSSNAGLFYRAYDTAGATVASQAAVGVGVWEADFTRYGGPGAEVAYATSCVANPAVANAIANPVYKWDGAAWAAAAGVALGGVSPMMLEVKADDNRLVGVYATSSSSRVGFSGAGTPETWGANDYVDLTPGDGERITSLVAWREMVFVFKESKYFVFGTTSTGALGAPVFNYRPVSTGVGAVGRQCSVATPQGVYFLSRRGIYRTTGGDPVLVSRDIDPIFRGGPSEFYNGGVLNHAAIWTCRLAWHDERLYFAFPSGSATSNDRTLVYDPEADQWTLWDVAANSMASFRVSDAQELVFTYAAGSNHVGRQNSTFTTDDGASISSRYQSGFYELAPGQEAFTRWTKLLGSGSPTVNIFTDGALTDPLSRGAAVTLASTPSYHLKSYEGRYFSHRLSSTGSAWTLAKLTHDVATARP